jgi:MYXO-CTERM domain-containing protein
MVVCRTMNVRHSAVFWPLILILLAPPAEAQVTAITLPAVASTSTDVALTLGVASFDAIVLTGSPGAGEAVTITVTDGIATLSGTDGLTFSDGGTGEASMSLSGSQDDINAALDGLQITPGAGFAGALTVTIASGALSSELRIAVNAVLDDDAVRAQVLAGVTQVHSGVQPGHMVAFGAQAIELAWFEDDPANGPLAAAGSWGAGRVIAVPDHQMLNAGSYGDVSGAFYTNGIGWLAASTDPAVAIVTRSQSVADWLAGEGYTDVTVANDADLATALVGAEVLIAGWLGSGPAQATLDAVAEFVRAGGGLFLAEYGVGYQWWWGKPVYDAPGNLLLREAGIGFARNNRWDTGALDVSPATGHIGVAELLQMLDDASSFSQDERDRASALFGRIYDGLQPDDPLVLALDAGFEAKIETLNPTPATPVSDSWEQALLKRENTLLDAVAVADIEKHRTADDVYGAIADEAPRVTKTVTLDPSITRWHHTGIYAPAGEVLTITVPPEAVDQGFVIRVSGHVDNISGRGSWDRMPDVNRTFAVDAESLQVGSAFGGTIYFDVGTAHQLASPFAITLAGGVEQPTFVLGQTTAAEWAVLRDLPGPQAELWSERCAISLPSAWIRTVDDMEGVMSFWNSVVMHQDTVAQHGYLRTTPERINIDVQISVGLLHAGYPTQGPTWASENLPDLAALQASGSWGWFHELGHEAQRRPDKSWSWDNPYTFDGSVEATVNIFSTYAYDQLGIPSRGGWSWTGSRVDVMQRAVDELEAGGTYADLGVGVKLAMFLQLRDTWGWDAFQTVFTEYNDEDPAFLPDTTQEERDQWLTRFSEAVGHDMTLFMRDQWLIEITPSVADALSGLPPWLPALGTIEGALTTPVGQPLSLALGAGALSHDGVAIVSIETEPEHGAMTDDGNGIWTYVPEVGFKGDDSFAYGVTSSTGHTLTSEVTISIADHGVLMEQWFDIGGTNLSSLFNDADYPDSPDETLTTIDFEGPTNVFNSYGVRMRAFLVPKVSGDYEFWFATDDNGSLLLSTDHSPANATQIAVISSWAGSRQWTKYAEQNSVHIALIAGHSYYIEGLMKEGGGGDNIAAAWAPADGSPEVIAGEFLLIYREDNTAPVAPDLAMTITVGETATFDLLGEATDADGDSLYVLTVDGANALDGFANGLEDGLAADGMLTWAPPEGQTGAFTQPYQVADGYGGVTSGLLTLTVADPAGPAAFAHVSPADSSAAGQLTVSLCWQASVGALSYQLDVTPTAGAPMQWTVAAEGTATQCVTSALPEGINTWLVTALDGEDHVREANEGVAWTVSVAADGSNPASTIAGPPIGLVAGCESLVFTGFAADTGSGVVGVEVQLDGTDQTWLDATVGGSPDDSSRPWSWTHDSPTDGTHTLYVRALDAEGNIQTPPSSTWFSTDCEGPIGTPKSPEIGAFVAECFTLEWTTDTSDAVSWTLTVAGSDGPVLVETVTGDTTQKAVCLPDASYTWQLDASDGFDNAATSGPWPVFVDTAAPGSFVLSGQSPVDEDGWICADGVVTLAWTVPNDQGPSGGAGLDALPYEVWLDGVALARQAQATLTPEPLAEGSHSWSVRAYDALGNWTEAEAPGALGSFGIDCTAPAVAQAASVLLSGQATPGATQSAGLSVQTGETLHIRSWGALCFGAPACDSTLSAASVCTGPEGLGPDDMDAEGGFFPNLPFGGAFASIGSPDFSALALTADTELVAELGGELVFWTNAANPGACSAELALTVHIGAGLGPWWPSDSVLLAGSPVLEWSEPIDAEVLELWIDGVLAQELEPSVTTYQPEPLKDGEHTWQLIAIDLAGNQGIGPEWTMTIDSTPPVVPTILEPAEGEILSTETLTVCWQAPEDSDENGSGPVHARLALDGSQVGLVAPADTCLIINPGAGEHCVTVIVRDAAGNETASLPRCFVVDIDRPSAATALTPPEGACVSQGETTLSWAGCQDTGAGLTAVMLILDGEEQSLELDATEATVPLDEGEHSWRIRCVDGAGQAAESETVTVRVDAEAPALATAVMGADLRFTLQDAGVCGVAEVSVRWDDAESADAADIDGGWIATRPDLVDGPHTFAIQVVDHAGNQWTETLSVAIGPCWLAGQCDLDAATCSAALEDGATCEVDGECVAAECVHAEPEPDAGTTADADAGGSPEPSGTGTVEPQTTVLTAGGNEDSGCQAGGGTSSPWVLLLGLLAIWSLRRRRPFADTSPSPTRPDVTFDETSLRRR